MNAAKFLYILLYLSAGFILVACNPATPEPTSTPSRTTPTPAETLTQTPTPAQTSTPQPRLSPVTLGPYLDDFPPAYNPLTGRAVQDPSLLDLPAVLVSISNMPVSARPQAGPGFAPWVFEFYIGEGTTRFLGVFYGDYPRRIPNQPGGCPVRAQVFIPAGDWIGNRVWLDENQDGVQDAWEVGVGGVCVHLIDGENGNLLASTSTDSNGYYAFNVEPERQVAIRFDLPTGYVFTQPNRGNEDQDSDADPDSGETPTFIPARSDSSWDAGLLLFEQPTITPSPVVTGTPPLWFLPAEAYVGPIRSGRMTYNHFYDMFPTSCLVYASAARGIREALHGCEIIFGVDDYDPNSSLLTVGHMRELATGNRVEHRPVNYSGNLFSDIPPEGGKPASHIKVFYHAYSQSAWEYDPISNTYLRFTDRADGTGSLVPATDRLSGRQQAFENVIVVLAEHIRIRHNQFDIDLGMSLKGYAWHFRDGQAYKIFWSTQNREYEKQTGMLRPLHFVDAHNNPVPLRPGRAWIHLVTLNSSVREQEPGQWLVNFVQPYDPPDTPEP